MANTNRETSRFESYHLIIRCAREFIAEYARSGEKVHHTACVFLRFQVESRFEAYLQAFHNALQMLHAMLHAPERFIKRSSTRIKFVCLENDNTPRDVG